MILTQLSLIFQRPKHTTGEKQFDIVTCCEQLPEYLAAIEVVEIQEACLKPKLYLLG